MASKWRFHTIILQHIFCSLVQKEMECSEWHAHLNRLRAFPVCQLVGKDSNGTPWKNQHLLHTAVSFSWDEHQLCIQLSETLEQSNLFELLPSPWIFHFEKFMGCENVNSPRSASGRLPMTSQWQATWEQWENQWSSTVNHKEQNQRLDETQEIHILP